jgi:thiamine-phosphate pyrophosphorylase
MTPQAASSPHELFSIATWSGLYLVTDASIIHGLSVLEAVEKAILGGLKFVQYREKNLSPSMSCEIAEVLRHLTRKAGATFIVNDDVSLALAVEADGVHLGQEDLPIREARKVLGHQRLIGVSTHSVQEASAAEKAGADYVGLGPIYPSTTKQTRSPLGCGVMHQVAEMVKIPFFAIGGINRANLREVLMAGATGAAVISAILTSPDITQATRDFLQTIASIKGSRLSEPAGKINRPFGNKS